ncbi:MAG TPA: hypothetical protein ENI80_04800 [Acidiferrobacteraceae bacterium]|nr:hypothetical protein [Acidiferrobacteraceae bacterium]
MSIWLRCACEPKVVLRAIKYALFVGIILILINHVDHIFWGEVTGVDLIKMGLTVLVPYLVSTFSSVGAILEMQPTKYRNEA